MAGLLVVVAWTGSSRMIVPWATEALLIILDTSTDLARVWSGKATAARPGLDLGGGLA
jgi:hypothetical protein